MDLHAWITQQVDERERIALKAREDILALLASGDVDNRFAERHIAANDSAAVLRRCEADRRILARHRIDPHESAFPASCEGCGLDNWDLPNTESVNDCPELLDLAHAHGITPAILASLDRPTPPEPKPRTGWRLGLGDILAPRTPMRDVPAALRGPHWKP
ncbi:DUF6221 family protein [Streptomyces sp. NPDC016640]|uniref:DUF6221 family protein n=1 Tax=Streptomyces sp. NPDC016640 TaxID=3364969 RepID=UPI0036FDBF34